MCQTLDDNFLGMTWSFPFLSSLLLLLCHTANHIQFFLTHICHPLLPRTLVEKLLISVDENRTPEGAATSSPAPALQRHLEDGCPKCARRTGPAKGSVGRWPGGWLPAGTFCVSWKIHQSRSEKDSGEDAPELGLVAFFSFDHKYDNNHDVARVRSG